MKHIFLSFAFIALVIFSSCNSNKVENPKPVESELITTMKIRVTSSGGFDQTFIYKVENGFGSTNQGSIQIDTIRLHADSTYTAALTLLNEKLNPVEDITEEVIEEKNDHLFLYNSNPVSGAGSITISNGSLDNDGKPFNQTATLATGAAGNGQLTITLKHEPINKNATNPADAGGETDAAAVFPVMLQ